MGDEATRSVEDTCNTIVGTAGIILTLLWTVAQRYSVPNSVPRVLITIRVASALLVLSILAGLAARQFIISARQRKSADVAGEFTVQMSFLCAWLTFFFGNFALLVAIVFFVK